MFVRTLGATTVVDHRTGRFEDAARNVDVVLDLIGGETQARSWAVLKRGGIVVSTVEAPDPAKAAAAGARPGLRYMTEPSGADLAAIGTLIDAGKVRVTVPRTFALEDVAAAQALLEAGGVRGKIAVTIA